MTVNVSQTAPPANLCRRDGTPLTPTCEIPIKQCCGAVLLGEECECGKTLVSEWFDRPIYVGRPS